MISHFLLLHGHQARGKVVIQSDGKGLWCTGVDGEEKVWCPGFRSKRHVRKTETGETFGVICQVVEDYTPEDGPLFRCAYHKINDSDMPSDDQVVEGRCATGVFHSLLEKIGMEQSKVKKTIAP